MVRAVTTLRHSSTLDTASGADKQLQIYFISNLGLKVTLKVTFLRGMFSIKEASSGDNNKFSAYFPILITNPPIAPWENAIIIVLVTGRLGG